MKSLLLVGLLVFVAWQSAFIVAPDEEGVVKRFGIPVRTVGPGPHGKIPLIESVLQPKVEKLHRIEVGFRTDRQGRQQMLAQEALMLTGDMNILAIEFIVQYKIKESANYLFSVAEIHETIGKAAEASMREIVGKSKIDEALTTGKARSNRTPWCCCNPFSTNIIAASRSRRFSSRMWIRRKPSRPHSKT
jgi:membrane protease subunit HflK